MIFALFIVLNLLLMAALFVFGMYQFMQVEDKRKRSKLLLDSGMEAAELKALADADRRDEAVRRLMKRADTDRFTAESTLARLRETEDADHRPSQDLRKAGDPKRPE
ncbi:MAG: hypothetical protein OXG85_02350 [Chloroflexi bacterium]|nr:hypothetical protein [Chloroflexota bacterium]